MMLRRVDIFGRQKIESERSAYGVLRMRVGIWRNGGSRNVVGVGRWVEGDEPRSSGG